MVDVTGSLAPVRCVAGNEGVRVYGRAVLFRPARDAEDSLDWPEWAPDLTDAATLGALEQPVREAWSDPALYAVPVMDEEQDGPIAWSIRQPARYGSHERGRGVTRGEAWLAAWNARPVPK